MKKKEDSFMNQLTAWTGTDTGLPLSDAVHNVSNLQRVSGFFFFQLEILVESNSLC